MAEASVEYSSRAAQQLEDLEHAVAERIVSKLDDVAWNPEHYLRGRRMKGSSHYALRIGDYRAVLDWRRDVEPPVLFVRRVGHRRNVYE